MKEVSAAETEKAAAVAEEAAATEKATTTEKATAAAAAIEETSAALKAAERLAALTRQEIVGGCQEMIRKVDTTATAGKATTEKTAAEQAAAMKEAAATAEEATATVEEAATAEKATTTQNATDTLTATAAATTEVGWQQQHTAKTGFRQGVAPATHPSRNPARSHAHAAYAHSATSRNLPHATPKCGCVSVAHPRFTSLFTPNALPIIYSYFTIPGIKDKR